METTTHVQNRPINPVNTFETVSMKYISWGAILAGVFVALSVAALLNLLGLGLDMLTISTGKESIKELSILSIIWMVLTGIISMTAGGWFAGRMSGPTIASEGVLHGLVTWAVTTLLTFALVTSSIGAVIGVMATFVSHSMVLIQENPNALNQQNYGLNSKQMAQDNSMNQQQNQNNATTPANEQTMQVSGQRAEHALGMVSLIIFVSFLLSAIGSAFGGMWGAYSDRKLFVREVREVR